KDGFTHFMAFDGERPVAIAALAVFEGLGYLTLATTAEGDRKRGAQSALISARIAKARELGCTAVVTETLTMLEHSLRNLERRLSRGVREGGLRVEHGSVVKLADASRPRARYGSPRRPTARACRARVRDSRRARLPRRR